MSSYTLLSLNMPIEPREVERNHPDDGPPITATSIEWHIAIHSDMALASTTMYAADHDNVAELRVVGETVDWPRRFPSPPEWFQRAADALRADA